MSKTGKVVFIIVLAVVVVGAIVGVTSLLNKEKTSITATNFVTIMENKGYSIVDAKSQFAEYSFVQKAYIALNENYQIEFYEMSTNEDAIDFYNNNVSIAEQSQSNISANTKINGKNYNEYALSENGKYKVISRINNTVVYLNVDAQYKNNVKAILEEIGY